NCISLQPVCKKSGLVLGGLGEEKSKKRVEIDLEDKREVATFAPRLKTTKSPAGFEYTEGL
ncbi:hypothetical protein CLV53_1427, partial [Sediminibacterium magnilacihabitans]